uniref:Myosin motor domain-containing protein n=1 Tax=Romanomermis culicivorax TaxID=13658 RepID=A0A915ILD7_ROMCU
MYVNLQLYSIGILDIFGFEDLSPNLNTFEQLCINYTNERLQAYFNQHIFQFEQEEYLRQGLKWKSIEYTDNSECLKLLHSKPYGLFCLIDEECSVPKSTDETLLEKFTKYQKNNELYETPQKKEPAFVIAHYAGKVRYDVTGFKEKNKDLMRQDLINVFKNSRSSFVRELVCTDPLAMYRWSVVRASFRAMYAFRQAGRTKRKCSMQSNVTIDKNVCRRSSESQISVSSGRLFREDSDASKLPK